MFTPITLLNFLIMNEKIIQEWLDLCPCTDLIVKNEKYFNSRNNFNRIKTILHYRRIPFDPKTNTGDLAFC